MHMQYETDDFTLEDAMESDGHGHDGEFEPFEFGDDPEDGELEFPEYEIDIELDEPYQFEDDDIPLEDTEYLVSEISDFEDGEYEFDPMGSEDEEIFGLLKKAGRGLKKLVRGGVRLIKKIAGPLLKKLAPIAARIVGGAIGGPAGAKIGGTIASAILREGELESAEGTEIEFERDEAEFEAVGGDIEVFEDMQDAASEIAEAESERRANRGLNRLMRGAMRLFGRNRRLRPIIPLVVRAALALVKTFRGDRRTRWAIRTLPLIIRRTLTRLARARKVDRKMVVLAMSRETAWVLANRRRAIMAMRGGRRRRRRSRGRRRRMNREELLI